jgi:hypothetical protein
MAQVILKKSSVAARVPTTSDLVFGELALNYADGLLYYKKSDGTTIGSIGGSTGGGAATATYTRTAFTATASQTVFTVTYTVGYVEVFYNGVLLPSSDYTATNGTSIILATAAILNDIVEIIAYAVAAIAAPEIVYGITGTTPALTPNNGTIQTWTLTANSTPTFGTLSSGQSMTLMVDDGTAYTITWPTVSWVGGSAPALATTGYNIIELWKVASVVYGAYIGNA